MKKQTASESKPMRAIRRIAMQYPEVEEGTSCYKSAFKARKKSFLFMGMNDETFNVMVKLVASLDEAERLEAESPDSFKVGAHGWTTVILPHTESPPAELMERWTDDSYRSLVHKQLVALLPDSTDAASPSTANVRRKSTKKAARQKSPTGKAPATRTPRKKKTAKKKRTAK